MDSLVKVDIAKRALAEAQDIQSVLEIRDQAAAIHAYAVARGAGEAANMAKELQLRAERKAGEFLAERETAQGKRTDLVTDCDEVEKAPILKDLGIERMQSSRWQAIASVPEPEFERYIAERHGSKELTQTGLLQLAARQRVPEPAVTPPFPQIKYRCIVIDPPWPVKKIEREERPNQGESLDYPTMALEEIAALPIADLGDDTGCHLYLWVTQKYLPVGLELVAQWGYAYQCLMTWRKNVGFTPYSWMYDTEHVIFAHKGNLPLTQLGLRLSFDAPVTGHSIKPDVFYQERVILASPEPRLEMFARKPRKGFGVWGNEL